MVTRARQEVLRLLGTGGPRLATVSGVLTTRPAVIDWVDREVPAVELVTTKSFQLRPSTGNREPIVCEPEPGSYGNAVGLANPGMETALAELAALRSRPLRVVLNVSLAAGSAGEMAELARGFSQVADVLELNLSCPHARDGSGSAVGGTPDAVKAVVAAVRRVTDRPLLAKLTPNVSDIAALATAAVAAGADGISAINTAGPQIFLEPHCGSPVLSSPVGGGRSGEWVRELAVAAVAAIRRAVGDAVPIIGMGGVSRGAHARRLLEAGANVVGVGSALARLEDQPAMALYLQALAEDARCGGDRAAGFLSPGGELEYRSHQIVLARSITPELRVLELDAPLDCGAGQFVFVFLPGVGEKPLAVAAGDRPTLLVRRRGPFTRALCDAVAGDRLLVRGPYGRALQPPAAPEAWVVCGGTGTAVAPELVRRLRERGDRVRAYVGVAARAEAPVSALVEGAVCVCDDGRPGAVVDRFRRDASAGLRDAVVYTVGPVALMRRVLEAALELGASAGRLFASLETETRCGVGLCGCCELGGRLLCRGGTFVSGEDAIRAGHGSTLWTGT